MKYALLALAALAFPAQAAQTVVQFATAPNQLTVSYPDDIGSPEVSHGWVNVPGAPPAGPYMVLFWVFPERRADDWAVSFDLLSENPINRIEFSAQQSLLPVPDIPEPRPFDTVHTANMTFTDLETGELTEASKIDAFQFTAVLDPLQAKAGRLDATYSFISGSRQGSQGSYLLAYKLVVAIPEPTTMAWLAGGLLLLIMRQLRTDR
jgi:hypothetical protein